MSAVRIFAQFEEPHKDERFSPELSWLFCELAPLIITPAAPPGARQLPLRPGPPRTAPASASHLIHALNNSHPRHRVVVSSREKMRCANFRVFSMRVQGPQPLAVAGLSLSCHEPES